MSGIISNPDLRKKDLPQQPAQVDSVPSVIAELPATSTSNTATGYSEQSASLPQVHKPVNSGFWGWVDEAGKLASKKCDKALQVTKQAVKDAAKGTYWEQTANYLMNVPNSEILSDATRFADKVQQESVGRVVTGVQRKVVDPLAKYFKEAAQSVGFDVPVDNQEGPPVEPKSAPIIEKPSVVSVKPAEVAAPAPAPAPSSPVPVKKTRRKAPVKAAAAGKKDDDCGVCHPKQSKTKKQPVAKPAVAELPKAPLEQPVVLAQPTLEQAEAPLTTPIEEAPVAVQSKAIIPSDTPVSASTEAAQGASSESQEPAALALLSSDSTNTPIASQISPSPALSHAQGGLESISLALPGLKASPDYEAPSAVSQSVLSPANGVMNAGFGSEQPQHVDANVPNDALAQGALQCINGFADRVDAVLRQLSPQEAKQGVVLGAVAYSGSLTERPSALNRRVLDATLERQSREAEVSSLTPAPFLAGSQPIARSENMAATNGDLVTLAANLSEPLNFVQHQGDKSGNGDQGRDRSTERIYAGELAFNDESFEESSVSADPIPSKLLRPSRDITLIG